MDDAYLVSANLSNANLNLSGANFHMAV
ncbi:MAG: hypothetical protein PHH71_04240 [Clostridia bacterium]|nr:hypothetical protein [Clostridia bacterium]